MATIGASGVERLRKARGLSQRSLAEAAGLSRQAVGAIESGRMQPTVQLALALARTLDATVEQLFGPQRDDPPLERVAVATIRGRRVAHRLDRDHLALEPAGSSASTVFIAGCDPAVGLLARVASERMRGVRVLWLAMTNRAALDGLTGGRVHAVVTHAPAVASVRRDRRWARYELATTSEGWFFAPENPLGLRGASDLVRSGARLANRPPGAGARQLLDAELRRARIDPCDVFGYERICSGQLDAGRAVADGFADAAIGTAGAARLCGLAFAPLREEALALLMPRAQRNTPELRAILDALCSAQYGRELTALDSYDTARTGMEIA